jgi:hypothetical protein
VGCMMVPTTPQPSPRRQVLPAAQQQRRSPTAGVMAPSMAWHPRHRLRVLHGTSSSRGAAPASAAAPPAQPARPPGSAGPRSAAPR